MPDLLPPRWKRCSMCRGRPDLARGRDPSRLDQLSDRKCGNTLLCILLLLGTFFGCDARSKPRLWGALYYSSFFASTSRRAWIIIFRGTNPFSISNRWNINAITENEDSGFNLRRKRDFKRKRWSYQDSDKNQKRRINNSQWNPLLRSTTSSSHIKERWWPMKLGNERNWRIRAIMYTYPS